MDTEGSAYECWRTETLKTVGGPGEHLFIVRVHLPRRPSAAADVFEKRESVSRSVMFDSLQPHGLQPTRILCPWNSLGTHWSGLSFPSSGDLTVPEVEPKSLALQADSLPSEPLGKPPCKLHTVFPQLCLVSASAVVDSSSAG